MPVAQADMMQAAEGMWAYLFDLTLPLATSSRPPRGVG